MPEGEVKTKPETADTARLARWLDEERRRDKALLVELKATVDEQARQILHNQGLMESLRERLDQTNAEVKSLSGFDQALQRLRDELLSLLQGTEQRLTAQVGGRDAGLVEERQARMGAVAALEQRIDQALKLGQQLDTQKVDMERLTRTAVGLQSQLDAAIKEMKGQQERLLSLAEGVRRSEEAVPGFLHAMEAGKTRSASIEESIKLLRVQLEQDGQQIAGLSSSHETLKQQQAELASELRRVDDRGRKEISGWTKEMASWREDAQRIPEKIAQADKQRRDAQQTLASLDALRIQLEKDRDALVHTERTAEERQRQQLEDWRKENELLWLTNEEKWQQLAQENQRRDGHVALLWETQLSYFRREVSQLGKFIKELEKRLLRPKS
jgi:chromosome segregation ATPase